MRRTLMAVLVAASTLGTVASATPAHADNPPNTCYGTPNPWVKFNGNDWLKGSGYSVESLVVDINYPSGGGETHLGVNVQPDGDFRTYAVRASDGGSTGYGTVTFEVRRYGAQTPPPLLCSGTIELVAP